MFMTPLKLGPSAGAVAFLAISLLLHGTAGAEESARVRARDLGVTFLGEPGALNAVTDVAGVEVGHFTLNKGDVRTGVTAIFPRGRDAMEGVPAGVFVLNGTGELTGVHFMKELGGFFGPIVLTGTLGVGTARNGILQWSREKYDDSLIRFSRILPVIGETYDGGLSDAWSFPLETEHVIEALDSATSGPVAEGSVGGGTGMVCFWFKCGIGTASRIARFGDAATFSVGVLVQANHGRRESLVIAGHPVGREIKDLLPRRAAEPEAAGQGDGSLIAIIATDAPLLPSQLERLARRGAMGMARTGDFSSSLSGDIFLAFTTANPIPIGANAPIAYQGLPGEELDPLLQGVAEAVEEAIINALVAGRDMEGRDGAFVYGLPHDRVRELIGHDPSSESGEKR